MQHDSRIRNILDTLEHAPPKRPLRKVLAHSVNLSVSRLRHLFKRQMGVSLGRFLRVRQMERARTLLAGSFLRVKEVMAAIGFSNADETCFIREFKKIYGVTPGQYRRLAARGRQLRPLEKALRKTA